MDTGTQVKFKQLSKSDRQAVIKKARAEGKLFGFLFGKYTFSITKDSTGKITSVEVK